ncbi:MAG TPA: glycerol-3-phosphate responsive antiterminator, partial [Limnochordia bacterium]
LDSEALKTGLGVLRSSHPDAVEMLPGLILPYIAHRLPIDELPPIIAGGMIETEQELKAVLASPAMAVSTSREALWGYR